MTTETLAIASAFFSLLGSALGGLSLFILSSLDGRVGRIEQHLFDGGRR